MSTVAKGKRKERQLLTLLRTLRGSFGPVLLVEVTDRSHRARARRRLQALPSPLWLRGKGLRRQSSQVDLVCLPPSLATKMVFWYEKGEWQWEKVDGP